MAPMTCHSMPVPPESRDDHGYWATRTMHQAADAFAPATLPLDLTDLGITQAPALDVVTLVVYGRPITQGSKTRTKWGMYDDNAKTLKPWRDSVTAAAIEAMHGRDRITADVRVTYVFTFDRPQGHFGTGRNAGQLRASAPKRPTGAGIGDLDKLERAICDSLKAGGVIRDDCLAAENDSRKVYVGSPGALNLPGARITVEVLP